MSGGAAAASLREELTAVIESQAILPSARQRARALYDRLCSPVRVVVLGLPGSGKSQVMNILAGRRILRGRVHGPVLELAYGPSDRMIASRGEGEERMMAGLALDTRFSAEAPYLRVETPTERLRQFALTEVRVDGPLAAQLRTVSWAAERADILLWCTTGFNAREMEVWRTVPDDLKDHGFLVLSKVDNLLREGRLAQLMPALEGIVAAEFHSLLPVAGTQAVSALSSPNPKLNRMFTASGAAALVKAVEKIGAQGRQADEDVARLFLKRFAKPADAGPPPAAAEAPPPVADNVTPLFSPPPEPKPAVPAAPAAPAPVAALDEDDRSFLLDTISVIRKAAGAISEQAGTQEPDEKAREAIQTCVAVASEIAERVAEHASDHPSFSALLDDVAEAADMMVLYQLEGGEDALTDAVALLLQLRREVERCLAA